MELYALLFVVFFGMSYAQTPLVVKFEDSETKYVRLGEHLKFVCHINRGLLYAIKNFIEVVRRPAVDNTKEVILSLSGKRSDAEPAFYNVSLTSDAPDESIVITFWITGVRDLDEGTLICRVRPSEDNPNGEKGQDETEIVVLRPLDALYLKFGDFDAISKDKIDPIEVESGTYTVQCIAEGSNPAPSHVHLYLHGVEIEKVSSEPVRMETDVIKYRTIYTGKVDLSVKNSKQEFECSAKSQLGDEHSVKLPIKIKVYDPKIVCNDSEAYRGKWYPVLTCTVDYEGLNIKSFKYELGDKEAVHEGTQNNDFVEVSREQLSESKARVILNLYQAQGWHFDTEFYLVVEHEDGHVTRESVRLHEIPGPSDSSNLLGASVATLIISLWCAHQLSL